MFLCISSLDSYYSWYRLLTLKRPVVERIIWPNDSTKRQELKSEKNLSRLCGKGKGVDNCQSVLSVKMLSWVTQRLYRSVTP